MLIESHIRGTVGTEYSLLGFECKNILELGFHILKLPVLDLLWALTFFLHAQFKIIYQLDNFRPHTAQMVRDKL